MGTAIDVRAGELNVRRQWRVWASRFASSAYAPHIDIEVSAIRHAAALIDVSPLYKYRVAGPDATRLVDRVITRDASLVRPGRVIYTPWCDEDGKVLDDGTLHHLDDGSWRWTAADAQLRHLHLSARGLDVTIEDDTDRLAAIALQGPLSRDVLEAAAGTSLADLRPFGRRPLRIGAIELDVSRTGYTGDLGYELWCRTEDGLALWDALTETGRGWGIRPAGILALDVVRIEAGLLMLDVDYGAASHAAIPGQAWSPYELGLGRFVALDKPVPFTGRRALVRERDAGGPPRRLVGLAIDWRDLERAYAVHDLTPSLAPAAWRSRVPVHADGRQVGIATSGTWSPLLKQAIALATVEAAFERPGTPLRLDWTIEGRRDTVAAVVAPLPFYDPPHRRA